MHQQEIDLWKLEEILDHQRNLDERYKGAQPSLCLECFKGVIIYNLKHRKENPVDIKSEKEWIEFVMNHRYICYENVCEGRQCEYTCSNYKKTVLVTRDPFSERVERVYSL